MNRYSLTVAVGVLLSCVPCGGQSAPKTRASGAPKKIILLAGPKDHGGPTGCGVHDYEPDLWVLKHCLDTAPNVKGITTELYRGRMPRDLALLKNAATIVVHSSSDRSLKEMHALFPSNNGADEWYSEWDHAYLKQIDELVRGGTGVVFLHYSLIIQNPRSQQSMLSWLGGYYREGKSRGGTGLDEVALGSSGHPILNGVRPWLSDHEYYFDLEFGENSQRIVPILTAMLPTKHPQPWYRNGVPQLGKPSTEPQKQYVIAWAFEREGGGRGFGFTGVHHSRELVVDDCRRMLLNAILWTARIEVPTDGVMSVAFPR